MEQIITITAKEFMSVFAVGQIWIAFIYILGALTHLFIKWAGNKIKSKKEQQQNNV